MIENEIIKAFANIKVINVSGRKACPFRANVVSEIPFTLIVNNQFIATLSCTPQHLKELAYGFLFTCGIIRKKDDITSYRIDMKQWIAYVGISPMVDPGIVKKKRYTSGHGCGAVYGSIEEIAMQSALRNSFTIKKRLL